MKKGREEDGKERGKEGRMERKRKETRKIPAADDLVDCLKILAKMTNVLMILM